MTRDELAETYRSYIDCLNRQDWDRLGAFVDDVVEYNGTYVGLTGYRAMLEGDFRAIPDLRFTIDLLISDPPCIASRLQFDYTPRGLLFDLPVNDKRVRFAENVFYDFSPGESGKSGRSSTRPRSRNRFEGAGMTAGKMRCQFCGSAVRPSARFCPQCTRPIEGSIPDGNLAEDLGRFHLFMTLFLLGLLNLGIFLFVGPEIGGAAAYGKVVDGHFYLGNHGKFTEVTETVFTYSLWHLRSQVITLPLAILAGFFGSLEFRDIKAARARRGAQT